MSLLYACTHYYPVSFRTKTLFNHPNAPVSSKIKSYFCRKVQNCKHDYLTSLEILLLNWPIREVQRCLKVRSGSKVAFCMCRLNTIRLDGTTNVGCLSQTSNFACMKLLNTRNALLLISDMWLKDKHWSKINYHLKLKICKRSYIFFRVLKKDEHAPAFKVLFMFHALRTPLYFSAWLLFSFLFYCVSRHKTSDISTFTINFQVTIKFLAIWLVDAAQLSGDSYRLHNNYNNFSNWRHSKWRLSKWIAIMNGDLGKFG